MTVRVESYEYEPLTADPDNPVDGQEWHRSDLGQFRRRVGGVTRISANFEDLFYHFDAAQLISPVNADWAINALAPMAADSNNAGLAVRLFDDTVEEGVGFQTRVPPNITKLILELKSRAETGPGGPRTVGVKLYNRAIPDNGSISSWTSGLAINDIDTPANEYFQYDMQEITLAALSITAGDEIQFELTRVSPQAGTALVGDWALLCVQVRFC